MATSTDKELAALPAVMEVMDGRYLIHGVLGEGGMAVVLSATHIQLDALVAIKLLRPELREHRESVERFLREGRAAARIRSEHVTRVHDVGVGPYGPFLVMEHLVGRDLGTVVREDGALSVDRAVDYVLQACEAIAEAHVAGVIHRDLKPANLFLAARADGSECVKVLDFGISKLTSRRSGRFIASATDPRLLMGSLPYMSPEQARSARDVDARTDIWALGATLHELLVGEPPFGDGPSHALLLRAVTKRRTPITTVRPDVPPALDAAIARCLSTDPRDRYSSVAELARAIAACGTSDARKSAGRIARISGVAGGWEVGPHARRPAGLRARDVVGPAEGTAMGARWTGFVLAIGIMGASVAVVVWRCNAALVDGARAVAAFTPIEQAPLPPATPGTAARTLVPSVTDRGASRPAPPTPEVRDAGAPARELLPPIDEVDGDDDDAPYPDPDASSDGGSA